MEKTNKNMFKTIEGKTKEEFKERLANFVDAFALGSIKAQLFGTSTGYCWKCVKPLEELIQSCNKDEKGNYFVDVEVARVALVPWVTNNFQNLPNKRKGR